MESVAQQRRVVATRTAALRSRSPIQTPSWTAIISTLSTRLNTARSGTIFRSSIALKTLPTALVMLATVLAGTTASKSTDRRASIARRGQSANQMRSACRYSSICSWRAIKLITLQATIDEVPSTSTIPYRSGDWVNQSKFARLTRWNSTSVFAQTSPSCDVY